MISAYLDRVEGNKAVLLLGDGTEKAILPAKYLPRGIHEGVYLRLDISYDEEMTKAMERESMALLHDEQGTGGNG